MTTPTPADLDQQVITTGKALIDAELADVRDQAAIDTAKQAYSDALAARYPNV